MNYDWDDFEEKEDYHYDEEKGEEQGYIDCDKLSRVSAAVVVSWDCEESEHQNAFEVNTGVSTAIC